VKAGLCKVERKWKEQYKQKFRRRAVARMNACQNITRLSRELGAALTVFILEDLSPLRKMNRDWHFFANHDSVQSCGFATNW
jgi:hypothetical protein